MELKEELEQKVKDLEALLNLKQQDLARTRQSVDQLVGAVNNILGMLDATQGVLDLMKKKEDEKGAIDVQDEADPKPAIDVDVAREAN